MGKGQMRLNGSSNRHLNMLARSPNLDLTLTFLHCTHHSGPFCHFTLSSENCMWPLFRLALDHADNDFRQLD